MRVWVVFALLLVACDEPASARSMDPAVIAARGDDPAALLESLRAGPGELGDDDVAFEDASGHALDVFHRALQRADAGEGTARIVMYGGSHTAGDHYTGRIREVLQARFGDGGHGFVPLVPVVRNHWAWGAVIDEAEGFEVLQVGSKRPEVFRYGLAGAAFLADEPEAFAAVTGDSWGNGRQATRVDLLYDRVPGGGTLEVWLDGALVDSLATAADPPRNGLRSYEVSDATHRLEVRAVGDGPVTVFGVVMERDVPGVVVHNLGLVGSKARHQLLWDEDQWAAYLRRLEPDLVVLAYGNNETDDRHLTLEDHERDLRAALARVERAAPDTSCLLLGPTDRPLVAEDGSLETRPLVADITAMQRRVAADLGCAFFDTLAFQGGLGSAATWRSHDPPYLGEDLQHLTRPGYLRWGEAVVRQLMVGYRPPA